MNNNRHTPIKISTWLMVGSLLVSTALPADELMEKPTISDNAKAVPHDSSVFRSGPQYDDKAYDVDAQLKIYGDKQAYEVHRPLLELGSPMYSTGLIDRSSYVFGAKNPTANQFLAYGDFRTVASYAELPNGDNAQVAAQLNLDLDWKLTATERIHILVRPFEEDGRLSRWEYNKDPVTGDREGHGISEFDAAPDAFFFEGDLGAIVAGASDKYVDWDLPFAVGLMPLLYQNGVWMDDNITGFSFAIPAMNSTSFDISNMDVSFFFGFDKVTSGLAISDESDVAVYGATTFIEANRGYWEAGYAFLDDKSDLGDQSYHNATVAFTRRYGGFLSNSVRLIGNFGQDRKNNADPTADGYVLLIENSWITSKPSTLIPYFNLFYGVDRPHSVARAGNAGGILKNTGITFDAGLAGLPTMDATAFDTAGFALGVEYLFALNQQIVVEASMLSAELGADSTALVPGDQVGIGVRYQLPLNKAWIFRADANLIKTDNVPAGQDDQLGGISLEIRRKF